MKREIKEIELSKAKQESQKADLEYNLRAAEYNVEIIKNQLENVNTEMELMKAQSERQSKTFGVLKQAYARLRHDVEYYKKGKKPPMRNKSQNRRGADGLHHTPSKSGKKGGNHTNRSLLSISASSAFNLPMETSDF